ncbi:hypothetical protein ACIG54_34355 [Streptomyces achromogenes]
MTLAWVPRHPEAGERIVGAEALHGALAQYRERTGSVTVLGHGTRPSTR